jgi:P4 family phage/plasmid primase-like protien
MPIAKAEKTAKQAGPEPAISQEIYVWLTELLGDVEGWLELRSLGVERQASKGGQHNESTLYPISERGLKSLARDARELTRRARGVYVTLNPVVLPADRHTATDADVVERTGLLIDIDPVRPAGTSSTDAELEAALGKAWLVSSYLTQQGWPQPFLAQSGNGVHLRYKISLPNSGQNKDLIKQCLRALDAQFSDESAKVDTANYNASRIVRLYGTLARKGEHTPERPHRASGLISGPTLALPVPQELLERLAALAPGLPERKQTASDGASLVGAAPVATNGKRTRSDAEHAEPNGKPRRSRMIARDPGDVRTAHASRALEIEVAQVVAAPEGERNITLFRAACALGELVEAGTISRFEVQTSLATAAREAGLPDLEIEETLASGFRRVQGKPRDLSHVGQAETATATAGSQGNGHNKPPTVKHADDSTGGFSEADDPHVLAERHLDTWHRGPEGYTLRWWNDQWWAWAGSSWHETPEKEVSSAVTQTIRQAALEHSATVGKPAKGCSTRSVGNVMAALRSLIMLSTARFPAQPFWIDQSGPTPPPVECLAARNVLVHLPTLLEHGPKHDGALLDLTPRLFTQNAVAYAFNPHAPEPAYWLEFLKSLWPDDPSSIECLQEWFGYLITVDTSLQKILLVVGPRRSGKGTLTTVLRALVGESNVAAPTLSSLAGQFGLQPLIGKTLAICPESRLSGRVDSQQIVERLLSISGEDSQVIDRKHCTHWHGVLATRFVLLGNELPRLGDYSSAFPGRVILLRLEKTFFGKEDTSLKNKLLAELPGILLWSLAGWHRLKARGRFEQPESSKELLEEFTEIVNPVGAFVAECCAVGEGFSVPMPQIYDRWRRWCQENGRDHPGDVRGFGRNLHSCLSGLRVSQPREGGSRVRVLHGLGLVPEPVF